MLEVSVQDKFHVALECFVLSFLYASLFLSPLDQCNISCGRQMMVKR